MLRLHTESDGRPRPLALTFEEFFLLVLLVAVCTVILRAAMISRLKARHSATWRELGAPLPMDFGLGHKAPRATGYLYKAKWVRSHDPVLVALGLGNFALAAITVVLFYVQFVSGY